MCIYPIFVLKLNCIYFVLIEEKNVYLITMGASLKNDKRKTILKNNYNKFFKYIN